MDEIIRISCPERRAANRFGRSLNLPIALIVIIAIGGVTAAVIPFDVAFARLTLGSPTLRVGLFLHSWRHQARSSPRARDLQLQLHGTRHPILVGLAAALFVALAVALIDGVLFRKFCQRLMWKSFARQSWARGSLISCFGRSMRTSLSSIRFFSALTFVINKAWRKKSDASARAVCGLRWLSLKRSTSGSTSSRYRMSLCHWRCLLTMPCVMSCPASAGHGFIGSTDSRRQRSRISRLPRSVFLALRRARQYPLALSLFDKLVVLEPDWAEAWNHMGACPIGKKTGHKQAADLGESRRDHLIGQNG